MELGENRLEAKPIPVKKACNKFDKLVKSLANFESSMRLETSDEEDDDEEENEEKENEDENENENENDEEDDDNKETGDIAEDIRRAYEKAKNEL